MSQKPVTSSTQHQLYACYAAGILINKRGKNADIDCSIINDMYVL